MPSADSLERNGVAISPRGGPQPARKIKASEVGNLPGFNRRGTNLDPDFTTYRDAAARQTSFSRDDLAGALVGLDIPVPVGYGPDGRPLATGVSPTRLSDEDVAALLAKLPDQFTGQQLRNAIEGIPTLRGLDTAPLLQAAVGTKTAAAERAASNQDTIARTRDTLARQDFEQQRRAYEERLKGYGGDATAMRLDEIAPESPLSDSELEAAIAALDAQSSLNEMAVADQAIEQFRLETAQRQASIDQLQAAYTAGLANSPTAAPISQLDADVSQSSYRRNAQVDAAAAPLPTLPAFDLNADEYENEILNLGNLIKNKRIAQERAAARDALLSEVDSRAKLARELQEQQQKDLEADRELENDRKIENAYVQFAAEEIQKLSEEQDADPDQIATFQALIRDGARVDKAAELAFDGSEVEPWQYRLAILARVTTSGGRDVPKSIEQDYLESRRGK